MIIIHTAPHRDKQAKATRRHTKPEVSSRMKCQRARTCQTYTATNNEITNNACHEKRKSRREVNKVSKHEAHIADIQSSHSRRRQHVSWPHYCMVRRRLLVYRGFLCVLVEGIFHIHTVSYSECFSVFADFSLVRDVKATAFVGIYI